MRKTAFSIMSIFFIMGTSYAADDIVLPAMRGNVTFTHKKHQNNIKNCNACHDEKHKDKINAISYHRLCMDCHEKMLKGPDRCDECH